MGMYGTIQAVHNKMKLYYCVRVRLDMVETPFSRICI